MKRSVTVPVFDIAAVLTDSAEEAQQLRDKHRTAIERYMDAKQGHDAVDPELNVVVGYVDCPGGVIVMCVTDGASVVHEAVHAAWEVCHYADIKADFQNQEPVSYLAQWFYDQWQEKMNG